jgi:hypothetical protein
VLVHQTDRIQCKSSASVAVAIGNPETPIPCIPQLCIYCETHRAVNIIQLLQVRNHRLRSASRELRHHLHQAILLHLDLQLFYSARVPILGSYSDSQCAPLLPVSLHFQLFRAHLVLGRIGVVGIDNICDATRQMRSNSRSVR